MASTTPTTGGVAGASPARSSQHQHQHQQQRSTVANLSASALPTTTSTTTTTTTTTSTATSSTSSAGDRLSASALPASRAICWCPEYEPHAFKANRCRNCLHPPATHDEHGCHFDPNVHQNLMQPQRPPAQSMRIPPSQVAAEANAPSKVPVAAGTPTETSRAVSLPAPVTPVEEPPKDHRFMVATEMLTTERQYCQSLNDLIIKFVDPSSLVLPESEVNAVFSNVKSIHGLSKEILSRLEVQLGSWSSNSSFATVFTSIGPMLRLYKEYAANYNIATKTLDTLLAKEAWIEVCRSSMSNPSATNAQVKLTISSLLILPVQRVPRYLLMHHDAAKHTAADHPDSQKLSRAIDLLAAIASEINSYMHSEETMSQALRIQNSLIGSNVPSLLEAHRHFVREGDVHKITSRFETICRLFLFNDLIVYSHSRVGNYFKYNGSIELSAAWVRPLDDTPKVKNLFQIVGPNKTWTFYSETLNDKTVWVNDITRLTEELVEKDPSLREKRNNEVKIKMRKGFWKYFEKRSMFDSEYAEEKKKNSSMIKTSTPTGSVSSSHVQSPNAAVMTTESHAADGDERSSLIAKKEKCMYPMQLAADSDIKCRIKRGGAGAQGTAASDGGRGPTFKIKMRKGFWKYFEKRSMFDSEYAEEKKKNSSMIKTSTPTGSVSSSHVQSPNAAVMTTESHAADGDERSSLISKQEKSSGCCGCSIM
ncbi:protein piccolo [Pelomyxa schiedti]|nr:protein piccolo [Pelomyxa schiedti]